MPTTTNIYKEYEAPAGEGGVFLKFEDGKPVKLRVASEPYIFRNVFKDKATGKETESVKYAWVVYNLTAEAAQILQLPVTGFKALQKIAADDDWGDPTGSNMNVKRDGTGKNTVYTVYPSPNKTPLTKEQMEQIATVDLPKAIENAITLVEAHKGTPLPAPKPREDEAQPPTDTVIGPDADLSGDIDLNDIPF
jgi:hypothetical protein